MDRDFGRKEEVRAQLNTVSELTPFQRRFLIEFLSQSGPPNATAAYIAAGGAAKHPDRAAYQIRHSPKVIAAIEEYFHKQEMGPRRAVAIMSQKADFDPSQYVRFIYEKDEANNGRLVDAWVDIERMRDDGYGHMLKGVKYTRDGRMYVEFDDSLRPLEIIMRYHGLLGPKGDESDPLHTVGMTLDEWRAEQERRRREAEAQTAETLDIFEDE